MNDTTRSYRVVELPAARRVVLNFLDLALKHAMYGLLEVDVTTARQIMDEHKARTGERLSFTGYLSYCLARAVDEDKSVQAYPQGRGHLVVFDDVDVGLMIERETEGTRAPGGYVVRCANRKTFMDIHREIRAIQFGTAAPGEKMPRWVNLLVRLPGPLQALVNAVIRMAKRRDPARVWVAQAGTVGVTSVGMFGRGGGWGLVAPTGHTLCLFVGGIARKPVLVGDRIEPRDFLSLTVAFDHDVVDGAPAARFARRLVELIEGGDGLNELHAANAYGAEPAAVGAVS